MLPLRYITQFCFNSMQSKGHVPTAQIAPTSDEYVLDQLSTCEEKLLKLLEELDGKELQEIMKQMEEEEVGAIELTVGILYTYCGKFIDTPIDNHVTKYMYLDTPLRYCLGCLYTKKF